MAEVEKGKKLKGVYLVPDPLMMKPHFGPSEHIKVGLDELKRYFDIEILLGAPIPEDLMASKSTEKKKKDASYSGNGFLGALRDCKLLLKSNISFFRLLREIRSRKVDFIYERGQYLDFRGVLIARILGIKHFYEVNWLNFLGIQQFYASWLNPVARFLEEWSYGYSTLNFFVGTQDRLISIRKEKVVTIQNGIGEDIVLRNSTLQHVSGDKIRICYVANLMPHHRFDVFVQSLDSIVHKDRIELHLIGYNFEEYEDILKGKVDYRMYGPVKKQDLPALMTSFNVGLISGGPSYSSFMKLFEYAAFKMCVICPDLENIKLMFDESEILYFKDGNPGSLADAINKATVSIPLVQQYGEAIYEKVKESYTWEKIYYGIAGKIENSIIKGNV